MRLRTKALAWGVRIRLIDVYLRAGWSTMADRAIDRVVRQCDDTSRIWQLSDILVARERRPDAERIYEKVGEQPTTGPETALLRGLAHERLGEPVKAADILEAEFRNYPDASYLREHLVRVCVASGQIERVARVEGARADDPAFLDALFDREPPHAKLIEYCLENGQRDLVEARLERARQRGAYDSVALFAIVEVFARHGLMSEAREIYDSISDVSYAGSTSYSIAAAAALAVGDIDRCLSVLDQGRRAHPGAAPLDELYVFALVRFLVEYHDLRRKGPAGSFEAMVSSVLERVTSGVAVDAKGARLLALFARYMDLDEAFTSRLSRALQGRSREVSGAARDRQRRALDILFALTTPMISLDPRDQRGRVRAFIEAARALERSPLELVEPITDMTEQWTPWQFLFCSADLQSYASAIAALETMAVKAWPKLGTTAAHVADGGRSRSTQRIRIGFMVLDVMPMMSGLVGALDPDVFETVFLRPGAKGQGKVAENWVSRTERVVEFSPVNSYEAIDTIASEQLDIIVSGPSGAATFFPLMARLARLQIILLEPNWTDGLSSSDYYISWQPAEPARPEEFYRTSVALMKNPPYFIERPAMRDASRESVREVRQRLLGARANDRIYLCANTPPKIHPDMDDVFRELLERDPGGTLVLLRAEYPPVKTLQARLHRRLGPLMERVVFLPTLGQSDAHRLSMSADACIDSFPLCGMSSSFDAAMLGVPIVTLPTAIPFGKWTAAIYDHIGVSGLVAKDREDYVRIAIRLANDPDWRAPKGAELRANSARFVGSAAAAAEVSEFITRAWERHLAGDPPADWIDDAWRIRETP